MLRYLVATLLLAFAHGQSGGNHSEEGETRNCDVLTREGLTMTPFKQTYTPGEEVSISCDEGYKQMVANLAICLTTGRFIFQRLYYDDEHDEFSTENLCKKSSHCDVLTREGLTMIPFKLTYTPGEEVSISCDEGYKPMVADLAICLTTGSFIFQRLYYDDEHDEFSTENLCKKTSHCGVLTREGLTMTPFKRTYTPGEEVSISCDEGYELMVANLTICLTTGSFIFQRLHYDDEHDEFSTENLCKRYPACEPPRRPRLNYSPAKPSFKPGEKVTLSCAKGYELGMPNNVVTCREVTSFTSIKTGFRAMRFRPRIPRHVCKKIPRCDMPAPQSGMVLLPRKDVYYRGDEVEIVCAEGYELTGPSTSVCRQVRSIRAIWTRFKRMKFVPEIPDGACRGTKEGRSSLQTDIEL